MKIDLVFLIVLSIVIAYLFMLYKIDCKVDKVDKIENMADVSTIDQIKELIKQVYQADVEAIRTLSNVATQLQAGGITVPGQLKVGGKLSTNNLDPANMPDGWGGGLRIFDGYASGTIGFGPDGKKLNAYINSGGAIVGDNLTVQTGTSNGDFKINGKLLTPNGHTIESVGRQHMTGTDNLYLLHKNGVIIGKDWGGNGNLYVGGDTNITGNLKVGNFILNEAKLTEIMQKLTSQAIFNEQVAFYIALHR